MSDVRPFDICGELRPGITVLEASAGTGKTYAIAALAARYVAEGVPLECMLLVTFTRMATGELRERVRARLTEVERALARRVGGEPAGADDDEIVQHLCNGSDEDVRLRSQRLTRAVADFDAATIATTHGFCLEVLGGMGVAGDVDAEAEFVEDPRELVDEVVDDLYVWRFHKRDTPMFGRADALSLAKEAAAHPSLDIEPADASYHSADAMRRRFALRVREELDQRKRRLRVMTYEDLLTRLDATLSGPGGAAAGARLRERFRVVLVDEFQDTDPTQWSILRRAFAAPGVDLVLIGDPKQAIYSFRGADVHAYLAARRAAATRSTLDVNWRSDQGLIDAYDALFGGAKLGHPEIEYRTVRAAPANQAPRLHGAPEDAPLRVRIVPREAVGLTDKGFASTAGARDFVLADLAADVARLLGSGATLEHRAPDGTALGREPVRPRDVAVLVHKNETAANMRDALEDAGIPAVINGAGSVFGTPAANDWLRLLSALERPTSTLRARTAALTSLVGWDAERLAEAGEDDLEELHRRLHEWALVLRSRGVAALMETITIERRVPERLLARDDGERLLTDLRHVAQLLHEASVAGPLGVAALTGWLRERMDEAGEDTANEERSRRLESDAEAVQVLTIHRCKGVEFPIVYCPSLWELGWVPGWGPIVYHDPDRGGERVLDVAKRDRNSAPRRLHREEERSEDLRLMYVALTRARHQAVVWWAGSWDSRNSPLSRLLFDRDEEGNVAFEAWAVPSDEEAAAAFEEVEARAPGCVSVERAEVEDDTWAPPAPEAAALDAACFDRSLDLWWRRTSYSDLSVGAHEPRVGSEPEEGLVEDEEQAVGVAVAAGPPSADAAAAGASLRSVPSLLAGMPVGTRTGTLVHEVLEAADFAAPDLEAELAEHLAARQQHRLVELEEPEVVVRGLRAALETPLGPVFGDVRLREVGRADRLDELGFELPLAGGDDPRGKVTLSAIGAALERHLDAGDPLAGYAERLEDPALRPSVRGYLTGSLDLVVRLRGDGNGRPDRFAVVDYKTNWLGREGEPLSVWHYRSEALTAEVQRMHYGLQALLYTVALHRYLRWRVPDYSADEHLAGVGYLFVRGMVGEETPEVDGNRAGVFAWRPPGALVEELSAVLDGEEAA